MRYAIHPEARIEYLEAVAHYVMHHSRKPGYWHHRV